MSIAFVFPGQGSQAVGMGKALADAFPAAKAVLDEADAALGDKLSTLMWEGPTDTLMLTENAQPALLTMSVAVLKVLQAEAGIDLKQQPGRNEPGERQTHARARPRLPGIGGGEGQDEG